eukprot:jgi/Botrbrau1/9501/Bobra.0252s0116.1
MGASISYCAAEDEEVTPQEEEQVDHEVEIAEVEEEGGGVVDITLETEKYDPRFPNTNQARHCYTRYNEFYKCKAEKGEDDPQCLYYQKAYRSLCPSEWLTKWNEQREAGTWPGKY